MESSEMPKRQEYKFPSTLLAQPIRERREYFLNRKIAHPFLSESFVRILKEAYQSDSAGLVDVDGRAGVGKTTLAEKFRTQIIKELTAEWTVDRERHPLVMVHPDAPERGNY